MTTPDRPSVAALRAVTQPPSVTGRRNAEHWVAELYLRRLSPYVTRLLLGTALTANGVTGLMILTGAAAGAALLVPGLLGAALAAALGQLQMLWDCCDGEVARWRRTFSPAGIFLDKVGHYVAEALVPVGLGVHADGGLRSLGGWTTLGALLSVLVLLNKALNDAVRVSRAAAGLDPVPDDAASARPRPGLVRTLRGVAGLLPFHRLYHSVELTLLALAAGVADLAVHDLGATRALVEVLVPAAVLTLVGHFVAIVTSSRLR